MDIVIINNIIYGSALASLRCICYGGGVVGLAKTCQTNLQGQLQSKLSEIFVHTNIQSFPGRLNCFMEIENF